MLNVYSRDKADWTPLITRNITKLCDIFLETSGKMHAVLNRYVPDLVKSGCPPKPGNYTINRIVVPRYRINWDSSVQHYIPLYLPGPNENYKIVFNVINQNGKILQRVVFEGLLMNSQSASQG